MSDGFNSYREWLGLSTSSPNYHELLGLPLQESDSATIATAAERAMTRVRSFRPGPQAREWARLLDEIRAAKECLLDPHRRAQYDSEQAELAGAEPILPPESVPDAEIAAPSYAPAANTSSDLFPPVPGRPKSPSLATQPLDSLLPEAAPIAAPAATTTWSAGPSPIYGAFGNDAFGNDAFGNDEAAPAPMPVPTTAPAPLPMPMSPTPTSYAEQPLPAATYGAPQQATFRAATALSSKKSRGRGMAWGSLAMIVVLGIAVAGLTYRLRIVAREQQLAEAAAAEAAAKRAAQQPPIARPARKLTPVAQSDEPTADLPVKSNGENLLTPEVKTSATSPAVSSPPPGVTANSPEPRQDAPTAAPQESPATSPTPPLRPTRAEIEQLIKSLDAAKAALVLQDFRTADSQLAKAAFVAKWPAHQEAVARLKEVADYVRQFRQALAGAVADLHAAESFQIGTTQVSFVEGKADAVILRTNGKNETYRFNDMPPGLATALIDRKLPPGDPLSMVVKGAYLLVNKRADSATRAKAEALWSEAQSRGADISHLRPFLNDDYQSLRADEAD